jgi:four helix bundle protein
VCKAVKSFRDLLAWQKAMDLIVACYETAGAFPKHEEFGLSSQLQRAAVSVQPTSPRGTGGGTRANF